MACSTCGKKRPIMVNSNNGNGPVITNRSRPAVIRGVVQKPTPQTSNSDKQSQ